MMYESYEDQESDGGGEWIDESNVNLFGKQELIAVTRAPFLDQFKISTPTSAAASQPSSWSSSASWSPSSLPRESILDVIMRIRAETDEKIKAMRGVEPERALVSH